MTCKILDRLFWADFIPLIIWAAIIPLCRYFLHVPWWLSAIMAVPLTLILCFFFVEGAYYLAELSSRRHGTDIH